MTEKEKQGDYLKCPKCGRKMEVLFQVPECRDCDFQDTDKSKLKEESSVDSINRIRKTFYGE
jgi:NMD protein affecting ribosome stability and mRNA decay